MPANTAIAVIANANAIAAQQRALEAKKIACKDVETHFTGTEGIEAKQQYAECIGVLYPEPANHNEVMGEKILIALMLVGFVMGLARAIWRGFDNQYNDSEDWLLIPFLWGCGVPIVAFLIGAFIYAIHFLFS